MAIKTIFKQIAGPIRTNLDLDIDKKIFFSHQHFLSKINHQMSDFI